ncbi:formin-binding protein 1-like [Halichondria panicea]|uniref:formin-binding protein 1-like n=1 Tax=Halichondria panicea TaxID=6063 RepID=UPI00312BCA0D
MSWGTELWDQYDKISSHTEQGIEFTKKVASFVEKRIHVEHSYAKDLRKLVKGFVRKDEDDSHYTAIKAFSKMINEVNDLAGQRELISEYLESEVLLPLKSLTRDIAVERRKHLGAGSELHRKFKSEMDNLDKIKKQYERASEDAENAQHKLEKADNDPNSTKAKIDQFTTTLRQKEQTAEECQNNYILTLDTTNDFRRQHFNSKVPALFTEIEGMNERLLNKYKELVAQFAECQRRVLPVVNTCLNNITEASEFIDAVKDNQQLVGDVKTGFPIPGAVEFEEYLGKQAKKAQKKAPVKVEPKEDYSHLPPEQRRKKLQLKVDTLETLKKKAFTDRTAMEKMQAIYTQQPKLGNAEEIKQSLEMNTQKITGYDQDLEKFRGFLAEAQRVLEAEPVPSKANKKLEVGGFAKKTSKFSPKPFKKNDKKKSKGGNQSDEGDDSPVVSPVNDGARGLDTPTKNDEWSEDDEDDDDEVVAERAESELSEPARILYDFSAQNEDELSVNAGDNIIIIQDLQDGWLQVRKRDEEGYVPESYVKRED